MIVQIDNFKVGKSINCDGPHGVCVAQDQDPGQLGIPALRLHATIDKGGNFDTDNVLLNIKSAIMAAASDKKNVVINLSMGLPSADGEESDEKHTLENIKDLEWFKGGHVIISQSAGNDGQNHDTIDEHLQNDPRYSGASKYQIKTGQVDLDENNNEKLTEYRDGKTSGHGKNLVYSTGNSKTCANGTSCAVYDTTTFSAAIWKWYPSMTADEINALIKSTAVSPQGGSYPMVDLKNAFLTAWSKYKCVDCQGINFGQKDNDINQLNNNPQQPQNANPQQNQQTLTPIPSNTVATEPLAIHVYDGDCTQNLYCDILIANATGGLAPYHFQSDTYANGTPPFGMTIGIYGHLTGTPNQSGEYTFSVCVIDTAGKFDCAPVTVTVNQAENNPPPQPATPQAAAFRSCIYSHFSSPYIPASPPSCSDTSDQPEPTVCNGKDIGTVRYYQVKDLC